MPANFPKRHEDGTFDVDLHFTLAMPVPSAAVEEWLAEWSENNQRWVREWKAAGKIVSTDHLKLFAAFRRAPYVIDATNAHLVIRLEGSPEAPFWRDWLARLVKELSQRFPGAKFVKAVDV